jgi:hypothetical protein
MLKSLLVGSLLMFGTSACANLEVANLNDPDAARSLATPGDVLSLIGGAYNNWFYGNYAYRSAGMAISNAAFQHNAPWANSGMEKYGRLPRIAFINSINDGDYAYLTRSWFYSYRAIAAVADGLKSLADPEIADQLSADEISSATAFARFVEGISHATVALLFSQGFVVDETTDLTAAQEPLPYDQLMDVAMGYFDAAISEAQGKSWTLPLEWMRAELSAADFIKVIHSFKARYMAQNARNMQERSDPARWTRVMAEIDAGITSDFVANYDDDTNWHWDAGAYDTYYGWSEVCYFIWGMADQSGNFQKWNDLSLGDKSYQFAADDPVLIITPDQRFPQGTTVDEQRATEDGRYIRIQRPGTETGYTWARPDRGTWRWSWYKHNRFENYWNDLEYDVIEIPLVEMNLLKAEGMFWKGDKAGAAAIVNETRTAAGLNATDANGTNTSCVPKLPDESCGNLWEMLKWEKRVEGTFKGPFAAPWFFDGRGWGDLWKDTWVQLPIPCGEAQVLQLLPCESYGGPGGEWGAPTSTYHWNGEG